MQDALLLVVQEYCHAMDMFKSRDSGYQEGTCILGQHGIGTMLAYDLARARLLPELQGSPILSCMSLTDRTVSWHAECIPSLF